MPVVHPLAPEGPGTFAWIPVRKARTLANAERLQAFHQLLTLVRSTVALPEVILRVPDDELSAWCYARRHARGVSQFGEPTQAPPDSTFTVFLSGRLVVQDWGWSDCDPVDRALPLDGRAQQGEVTWRRTK
jgi:hypothetical protein